jgi:hypothetical protein
MEATKQHDNDYAVAQELNDCVLGIFSAIQNYQIIGRLKDFDPEELNRIYVLLVDELEKLYERNPKLAAIKPEPTWKQFEIIKNSLYSIQKYLEEHDSGHLHRDKVEKLCIIAGNESPDFSPEQKKLVERSKTINAKYHNLLVEQYQKLLAEAPDDDSRPPRMWYIPEYTIEYKLDGTILINNALKLKKIHAGSTTERLMEQSIKNPEKLFKPSLGQTARNVSTILSSAGFTPTLRQLFFPTVSDDKGIIFRPKVTREVALDEKIDLFELDAELHKAGAKVDLPIYASKRFT